LVGFLRGAETGKLPHRPQAAPVHRPVNAPGTGKLARMTQVPLVVQAGHVAWSVQPLDGDAGGSEKSLFALPAGGGLPVRQPAPCLDQRVMCAAHVQSPHPAYAPDWPLSYM